MFAKWVRSGLFVVMLLSVYLFGATLPVAQAATCTWTGSAGDGLWATATNWSGCTGGGVPTTGDTVVLDNATVSGSYMVTLPSGTVGITITKLTITPNPTSNTITLLLPSSNTANPGLTAGDGVAGTDDIVLDSGAVLKNSSGASAGNGIQANTTANGTVRINNGGKFVHNTARSTAGIVPLLSTVAGTELGIFEYDNPGTGSVNISASGRNYGSLLLTRTAGAATYVATGTNPLTVRGDLTINSGVTFNDTMSGYLNLSGNWNNNGVGFTGTSTVALNGSSAQTIGGSATTVFNNLVVSNTLGSVLNGASTVNGSLALSAGDLNTGANVLTLGASATVTGTGDVVGTVRRVSPAVGSALQFNNRYTTINFTTAPTQMDVTLTKSAPSDFVGAVQRYYTLTPTGSVDATIQLAYQTSELNGTSEPDEKLWRYDTGQSKWVLQGGTANTTNHYVSLAGVTQFSRWAIGNAGVPTAVTLSNLSATPATFDIVAWFKNILGLAR